MAFALQWLCSPRWDSVAYLRFPTASPCTLLLNRPHPVFPSAILKTVKPLGRHCRFQCHILPLHLYVFMATTQTETSGEEPPQRACEGSGSSIPRAPHPHMASSSSVVSGDSLFCLLRVPLAFRFFLLVAMVICDIENFVDENVFLSYPAFL